MAIVITLFIVFLLWRSYRKDKLRREFELMDFEEKTRRKIRQRRLNED